MKKLFTAITLTAALTAGQILPAALPYAVSAAQVTETGAAEAEALRTTGPDAGAALYEYDLTGDLPEMPLILPGDPLDAEPLAEDDIRLSGLEHAEEDAVLYEDPYEGFSEEPWEVEEAYADDLAEEPPADSVTGSEAWSFEPSPDEVPSGDAGDAVDMGDISDEVNPEELIGDDLAGEITEEEWITVPEVGAVKAFSDVMDSNKFFYVPVYWGTGKGIVNGTSATTFSPYQTCTRGQILTFIWRANGSPKPSSTATTFSDLPAGKYYYEPCLWALENGIATGRTDTAFEPNSPCTRAEAVYFIWGGKGKPAASGSVPFEDVSSRDYYYQALIWGKNSGVVNGKSTTRFAPDDTCTRGEIITFLYRALGKNDAVVTPTPTPVPVTYPSGINGKFFLHSVAEMDRCMDVTGGSRNNGVNIQSYDYNGSAGQQYSFEPVTWNNKKNYYYRIITNAGKVVEAASSSAANGTNVQTNASGTTAAKLWHPVLESDGTYSIRSAINEKYALDIAGGSVDYGANIRLWSSNGSAAQKWYLTTMKISSALISGSNVIVKASGSVQNSDDNKIYLFAIEPYEDTISGKSPVANTGRGTSVTITAALNKDKTSSLLQKKLVLATKEGGKYRVISDARYITNPEAAASKTNAFPTPSRGTKKGLKMQPRSQDVTLAKQLKVSHVILDCPIEGLLADNAVAYNYEGKTYYFSANVGYYGGIIKQFADAGIVTSIILYMSNRSGAYANYVLPEARSGSGGPLYALNTQDGNRKRLEALFAYIGENWSPYCGNYILGNEMDQFTFYHYSGDISYNLYHEYLAEEFRMFNASIKSRWSNARTYISLDHNWGFDLATFPRTHSTYPGLNLTSNFNTDLIRQGFVHWDMAMHPYPSPEQDCRYWNRPAGNYVTDSFETKQVTMANASAWSKAMKNTFGSSLHIIMSETGLSSIYNGVNQEPQQAAAVALGYYITEFDSNIDIFGLHREQDQGGETAGGWYLGLLDTGGRWKPSASVFRDMDTKNNSSAKNYLKTYVGSDWQKKFVPGYTDSKFSKNS